jgi:preprotein translocase subunit SecF
MKIDIQKVTLFLMIIGFSIMSGMLCETNKILDRIEKNLDRIEDHVMYESLQNQQDRINKLDEILLQSAPGPIS